MKKKLFSIVIVSIICILQVFSAGTKEAGAAGIKDPVTMYVDVAVGGARDVRARVVAEYLSKELGVPVNVENITGGGGITCATHVVTNANSPNDLFFGAISMFTASPQFSETLYSIDDYIPLVAADSESFGLFTCPSRTGIASMEDLIEYAKNNEVIYGSGGVGNVTHLYQAGLYAELGFPKANTLAHNGAVIGITNCMGGHNVVTMAGLETARSYVESGDIVPILTYDEEPYTGYEGFTVPSVVEYTGDSELAYSGLMFISCLATCPEENVEILRQALQKVMANPDCVAALKAVGALELEDMTTEEMLDLVDFQYDSIKVILEKISK